MTASNLIEVFELNPMSQLAVHYGSRRRVWWMSRNPMNFTRTRRQRTDKSCHECKMYRKCRQTNDYYKLVVHPLVVCGSVIAGSQHIHTRAHAQHTMCVIIQAGVCRCRGHNVCKMNILMSEMHLNYLRLAMNSHILLLFGATQTNSTSTNNNNSNSNETK